MLRQLEQFIDPQFLTMMFAAIAAGATVLTLAMPLLARDTLSTRMKAVAFEREKIRQRERERLAQGKQGCAAAIAESVHEDRRRELQSQQMGRPGGSARRCWCKPAIAGRRLTSLICSSAW